MEKLILEEDTDFPGIILDKDAGIFKITGRSIPHDTSKFYIPVIEWFREYSLNPNESTSFEFKLEYFNTSSQKYIADLFKLLDKMYKNGYKTKVVWTYQHDDEDMRDIGKEFDYIFELPFEFKEF